MQGPAAVAAGTDAAGTVQGPASAGTEQGPTVAGVQQTAAGNEWQFVHRAGGLPAVWAEAEGQSAAGEEEQLESVGPGGQRRDLLYF